MTLCMLRGTQGRVIYVRRSLKHCLSAMALFMVCAISLAGCGERLSERKQKETEKQTQAQTEAAVQTEAPVQTEKEPQTEKETQKIIQSVLFNSKDATVQITLPDNTWKVTQDEDAERIFSSGNAAMINISHADTPAMLENLSLQTSETELKAVLTRQYSSSTAFEVESFVANAFDDVKVYRYVIRYTAAERFWAYKVTYGVVAPEQAYVVTGTVMDENAALLAAVEKSVDSFRVLKDEKLKQVTSAAITGTTQKAEPKSTSADEIKSLNEYNAVTLYANDTVNVRKGPGTDADVVGGLTKGDAVSVTGETTGWFRVNIGGTEGYVRKDFLVYNQPAAQSTQQETTADEQSAQAEVSMQTDYGTAQTLYASDNVNIRSKPGTESDVTGGISQGSQVTVIGETDNWFVVSVDGQTGYVSKQYLTSDYTGPVQTGTDTSTQQQDQQGGTTTPSTEAAKTAVSGNIIGSSVDTVTIAGDDGNTYTVYTGDASVTSVDGIYDGVYVSISLDSTQAADDGTLYATSVTGY